MSSAVLVEGTPVLKFLREFCLVLGGHGSGCSPQLNSTYLVLLSPDSRCPLPGGVDIQKALGESDKRLNRQTAMTLVHGGLESERDPRPKPLWGGLFDPELFSDGVCRPETYATDVPCEMAARAEEIAHGPEHARD